ncbi:MAG: crossover junction endodeoxyribonuclease RuvC [Patescibacteria group bacterium]
MARILGIDPGYERLGIAVLEKSSSAQGYRRLKEKVLFSECFKTSSKLPFEERLLLIADEAKSVIEKYKPEILSIETLFLNTNQKTVMHVAEARGVIICEAMRAGMKVFEATPLQIKIATTGYGRADKTQMIKMVKMLVEIDESKKSDDELDAIAIALTAFANLRLQS